MYRRDYILRMMERFAQQLLQIREQFATQQHAEASAGLEKAFLELVGAGPDAVSQLPETELLARLMVDGPTNAVRDKTYLLVSLLQEAARRDMTESREAASRACLLKALNLLLTLQLQDVDSELPQFVPTIDGLRDQLREASLPAETLARLWRHYERIGAYGHAEDAVFELLETEPGNAALLTEAKAFYERLLRQSDRALEEGNLPRAEVVSGLAELNGR